MLYTFLLIEHESRRLIHTNVTANPTADWARQQIREAIPSDHQYRHRLFLDGVLTERADGRLRFQWVSEPDTAAVTRLNRILATRIGRYTLPATDQCVGVETVDGFSLHAGVSARANQRKKLERLCRYITGPAIAQNRLSLSAAGNSRYQLKAP